MGGRRESQGGATAWRGEPLQIKMLKQHLQQRLARDPVQERYWIRSAALSQPLELGSITFAVRRSQLPVRSIDPSVYSDLKRLFTSHFTKAFKKRLVASLITVLMLHA